MKAKRIAGYVRVSHDEQKKYGYSVQAQIERIIRYAEENNCQLVEIFVDEGFTATKMKRPDLLRMLDNLDKFDILIFTRLDRFSRNVLQANKMVEIMDEYNVAIKSIEEDDIDTSTADGRFNFNLRVSLAQREAEKTSERIKSIFEFKIKNGQPVSGNQPFGYKIETKDNKKTIIKDPELVPIIKDIFNYFSKYHTMRGTMTYINGKYDISKNYNCIRRVLTSTEYYGLYEGNPTYYPPYISQTQYERNQQLIKANIKERKSSKIYLFTSLIKCPFCGFKMVGKYTKSNNKNGTTREYYGYICSNHQRNKLCPSGKVINENYFLDYLFENIEELAKKHIAEVMEIKPAEQTDLPTNRINEILEEMDRLTYSFRKKRISVKDYDRDYEALEKELAGLQKEAPKESDITILEEFLRSDWKTVYNSLSKENQRAIWRNLIKEIKLDKEFKIKVDFL
jgi:DNA invertase Pin-like site-specific DNA recombinase